MKGLTSSSAASPAKTCQSQGIRQDSTALEAACFSISSGSYAWFDRESCCWRTSQASLLGPAEEFSQSLPPSGLMLRGRLWPLPMSAHPINGAAGSVSRGSLFPTPTATEFTANTRPGPAGRRLSLSGMARTGNWPTPIANDHKTSPGRGHMARGGRNSQLNVAVSGSAWPTPTVKGNHNRKGSSAKAGDGLATAVVSPTATPTARDWKSSSHAKSATNSRPLSEQMGQAEGGCLNPEWVEALMGFPVGWTEL